MFLQELRTLRLLRHFVQLDPTLHMLMAPICRHFVSASGALQLADVELPEPIARRPSPHAPSRVEKLRFLRHLVQPDPTVHMLMAPICGRFRSASGALQLADVELPEPIARRPSPHVPSRVENIEILERLCAT